MNDVQIFCIADLMAKTLKQTEDRVAEVRRRAEEAVSDVKRQAVIELQKAVCAAEEKANDALAQAHQRMDKAVSEARRQATDETLSMVNKQDNSREVCTERSKDLSLSNWAPIMNRVAFCN